MFRAASKVGGIMQLFTSHPCAAQVLVAVNSFGMFWDILRHDTFLDIKHAEAHRCTSGGDDYIM